MNTPPWMFPACHEATICEGLGEISSDLPTLDPKQSELLLKRAIALAREHNLNIDSLMPRKSSPVATAA